MKETGLTHYIKYFSALLLFGSNGIVASRISLSSYEIVYLRTMIGSLLLLLIFLLTGNRFRVRQCRRDFVFVCISGMAMGAGWGAICISLRWTGSRCRRWPCADIWSRYPPLHFPRCSCMKK